uniref:Uncharacterized protein n=1 Tax=Strongyloides papillosus TaxID=174720 RepID=A0A0N5C6Q0_STREA
MPAPSHNFFENRHISFYSDNNLYENMANFDLEFMIPCCSRYIDIKNVNNSPATSQSLPTSFFGNNTFNKHQINSTTNNESTNEITQTVLNQKSSRIISHSINILYSSQVKGIANELTFLCDKFDKEFYNDMKSFENINGNCNNVLSLFVTSIMYCISDLLNL